MGILRIHLMIYSPEYNTVDLIKFFIRANTFECRKAWDSIFMLNKQNKQYVKYCLLPLKWISFQSLDYLYIFPRIPLVSLSVSRPPQQLESLYLWPYFVSRLPYRLIACKSLLAASQTSDEVASTSCFQLFWEISGPAAYFKVVLSRCSRLNNSSSHIKRRNAKYPEESCAWCHNAYLIISYNSVTPMWQQAYCDSKAILNITAEILLSSTMKDYLNVDKPVKDFPHSSGISIFFLSTYITFVDLIYTGTVAKSLLFHMQCSKFAQCLKWPTKTWRGVQVVVHSTLKNHRVAPCYLNTK